MIMVKQPVGTLAEHDFEEDTSKGTPLVNTLQEQPHILTKEPTKVLTKEERKELAMTRRGITDDVIFDVAYQGLTATKVIEERDTQGNVIMTKVPDNIIRHKFLDSVLRVKGYIRADATVDATVNFNLTVNERAEIKKRLSRVIDIG